MKKIVADLCIRTTQVQKGYFFMYRTDMTVISPSRGEEYAYFEQMSLMAKLLYNAALFIIRQVFTGWNEESIADHQKDVFAQVEVMQAAYPHICVRRVLSYRALDAIMRANENPDFFAELPMQTAQAVLKEAVTVFKAWLSSLKKYKQDPSGYTGKPRMPGYLKDDKHTFTISNQDAVLYPVYEDEKAHTGYKGQELKLPGRKERISLPHLREDAVLREVKVKPYYGNYLLILTLKEEDAPVRNDMPYMAGIDLGVDNIAAIVSTDSSSRIYKGGVIKSINRFFNMKRAEAVGILTRGTDKKYADSRHLQRLSLKRDCFMNDALHKISTDIIRYCKDHKVGTIVIGVNKGWKQNVSMGKTNNQNFVQILHYKLRFMIAYKAAKEGITVIEQEESYTSKADCTAKDFIPVYGKEEGKPSFSGSRIQRGLYRTKSGLVVNADCNGAANTLRKAFPDAWDKVADFRFLAVPEPMDLRRINRAG